MGQLSLLPDEQPGPRRISVTSLVDLRRCPRKFAFAEVEGHGRRAPGNASLGLAVHRAIQTGADPLPQAEPYVAAYRTSGYAERRLVAAELPIRLQRHGITITGRIDAVFAAEGDGWELVDFKTGSAPSDPEPADDAQLEVYALAAIEGYGRVPDDVSTTYLYLATGETRSHRWSTGEAAAADARLAADLARLTANDYPAQANRSCPACDALEECDVGRAALIRASASPSPPPASSA